MIHTEARPELLMLLRYFQASRSKTLNLYQVLYLRPPYVQEVIWEVVVCGDVISNELDQLWNHGKKRIQSTQSNCFCSIPSILP